MTASDSRQTGGEFIVVAPDPKTHCRGIAQLKGRMEDPENDDSRSWDSYRRLITHEPFYVRRATRIGLIKANVVTHWGVFRYTMRIGSARVRVGGIGDVITDEKFRRRGLMARTARASIEAMRQLGYDMTILFGIRDFYNRFGYVSAWPFTTWIIKVTDLPARRPEVKLRRCAVYGQEEIARIYNRQNATCTGTAVRPTWSRRYQPNSWQGYSWADRQGRTAGYVVVGNWRTNLQLIDAGGDVEQVLRVLRAWADRHNREEVQLPSVPHDHPLARRLRRETCRLKTEYCSDGGAMIRTLNLRSTLQKMSVELSRRLKRSVMSGWRGGLLIADPREKVKLAIDRSRLRVCTPGESRNSRPTRHTVRGGEEIAQLLIGTRQPEETVDAGRIRLTGDARKLIAALFPDQHPTLGIPDRY